jgi:hypothetical protein
MAQENVELLIPFESLVDCIEKLNMQEKIRLWELLDEEIAQVEEDILEQDPIIQAEIQEARDAYKAGNYMTLDEYISKRRKNSKLPIDFIQYIRDGS